MTGIQTAGPGVHRASPCGCNVGTYSLEVLRELDTEPAHDQELHIGWSVDDDKDEDELATDGGQETPHHCDICGRDCATVAELINHPCEEERSANESQLNELEEGAG